VFLIRQLVLFATATLLLLSGCAGTSNPQASATETVAPSPTATDGLGSITGGILDAEFRPIPEAEVGLLGTDRTARSDARGNFTFNGLEPGDYTLAVGRIGFESDLKKVLVRAGEVTNVVIQLQAFVIPEDPVIFTQTHTGFIVCSYNPYYFVTPCSPLGENKDHFDVEIRSDLLLKQVILELAWTPTTPATAQELELDLCLPQDTSTTHLAGCAADDVNDSFFQWESGRSPVRLVVPASAMPYPEQMKYQAWVGSGFLSPYPTIQQTFDLHVTTCYVEECPKDYSVLPAE
jgi:hypothetical protein